MVRGAYLWPCFLMASLVSGWAAQESKEAEGASWWSLQPLKRVELPSAHDQSLHPVDAFIGQALEKPVWNLHRPLIESPHSAIEL